jgi:hypothetical protein
VIEPKKTITIPNKIERFLLKRYIPTYMIVECDHYLIFNFRE